MNSPFKTPWHFDNFKEDKEGEYVKIVGRFNADWSDEVVLLRGGLSDLVFAKEYNIQHTTHKVIITPQMPLAKITVKKTLRIHMVTQPPESLAILNSAVTKNNYQKSKQ